MAWSQLTPIVLIVGPRVSFKITSGVIIFTAVSSHLWKWCWLMKWYHICVIKSTASIFLLTEKLNLQVCDCNKLKNVCNGNCNCFVTEIFSVKFNCNWKKSVTEITLNKLQFWPGATSRQSCSLLALVCLVRSQVMCDNFHSSQFTFVEMMLNGLLCADVPLHICTPTHCTVMEMAPNKLQILTWEQF